ncbi:hypothetical protein CLF_111218 [Clonorchis sinensis]|uniref:Uncharacterized protein n=1 Tax=Clonorchis sinensis TaxID=79923 RepID=G7YLI0_CLOSI|nr:hypothetical protein CLF_111218 [Clonorchis sinensis]
MQKNTDLAFVFSDRLDSHSGVWCATDRVNVPHCAVLLYRLVPKVRPQKINLFLVPSPQAVRKTKHVLAKRSAKMEELIEGRELMAYCEDFVERQPEERDERLEEKRTPNGPCSSRQDILIKTPDEIQPFMSHNLDFRLLLVEINKRASAS